MKAAALMLMAQDNSSGHHLNAHVDSDIWWAAGENYTRQDTGILISGTWLAVLQRQQGGNGPVGLTVDPYQPSTPPCCKRGHMALMHANLSNCYKL